MLSIALKALHFFGIIGVIFFNSSLDSLVLMRPGLSSKSHFYDVKLYDGTPLQGHENNHFMGRLIRNCLGNYLNCGSLHKNKLVGLAVDIHIVARTDPCIQIESVQSF